MARKPKIEAQIIEQHPQIIMAQREAPAPTPPKSEYEALLAIVEHMMGRPDVPIDRFTSMVDMLAKVKAQEAKRAFELAFSVMQPKLPVIQRKGTAHNSKKYALWEDIVTDITPVTSAHGFSLRFRTQEHPDGRQMITAVLGHEQGHSEETTLVMPNDKTGDKNEIQSIGSTVSYGKRYAASALLNIVSRDGFEQDTDGAVGITPEQQEAMIAKCKAAGVPLRSILAAAKVEKITQIADVQYGQLMKKLDVTIASRAGQNPDGSVA